MTIAEIHLRWSVTRMNVRKYFFPANIVLLTLCFTLPLWSEAPVFSVEDAVKAAMETNPGIESAHCEWLSASAKAEAAQWRRFPSLSVSAGYQRLSELPPASMEIDNPFGPGTVSFDYPPSLINMYSFDVNLQYPVFSGFRIREAAAIASLQADGKLVTLEMVKLSLIFEVRRAYWEAVRASNNVETLKKNLELVRTNRELVDKLAAQGSATRADQLTAAMRYNQAEIDLGDALSMQMRAYMVLASLTGDIEKTGHVAADPSESGLPYILSSRPGEENGTRFDENLDEMRLIQTALERRPETRLSSIAVKTAEHGTKLAQAPLYPALALNGNYTLANPNQRVFPQKDAFTGTWTVGVNIGYDLGGLAATINESVSQKQAIGKARADAEKQRNIVILDVRTCLLNLVRTRKDLGLTKGMIGQAEENLRVVQQKFDIGVVKSPDLLAAQLDLLRTEFAIINREIDVKIANADLSRALALDEIR
ncbi:MAG: TolC family protein [Spirochaetales bacterium]|nr:TolC family protein [Spirochaetales bacterium]